MYSSSELQTVQLLPGGNYVTVSQSTGNWSGQAGAGRGGKGGARGGPAATKSISVPVHTLTPVARQVAYIDTSTGNLVTSAGRQTFQRRGQAQPGRPGTVPAQGPAPTTAVVQVQGYQQNGQEQQPSQVLQLQATSGGPQVYKLTNGTRVVKAGQPFPNTTFVQTAAVPPGSQQVNVVALGPQGLKSQHQQQLQMQGMQVRPAGTLQLQGTGTQAPQQAKLTPVQQQGQPAAHVILAQPQAQVQQIQPPPQQPGTRPGSAFQTVAVRHAPMRPPSGGPITVQSVYVPPPAVSTTVRPQMRIPKLGTVATYNPVTGVRSAANTAAPGGITPVLPTGLPPAVMQQVQKAQLLQQQQQHAGLQTVIVQQGPGQSGQPLQVRQVGLIIPGGGGGGNTRQTTLVVGSNGVATTMRGAPVTVLGGGLQAQPQQGLHSAQLQQQQQQGLQQAQQGQQAATQQVVNITLADGTTATTVMDAATLARMLSESSRGQAAKLQQQQQQQQLQHHQLSGAVGCGPMQVQVQTIQLQQQQQQQPLQQHQGQMVLQSQQLALLGGAAPGGAAGGMEALGGLQRVQLTPASGQQGQQVPMDLRDMAGGTIGVGRGNSHTAPQQGQFRGIQVFGPSGGAGSLQPQQGAFTLDLHQKQSQQSNAQAVHLPPPPHHQQQAPLQQGFARRSLGHLAGGGEADAAAAAAAAVFDTSAALAAQLQALGAAQPQPQRNLAGMVDGLSVVDLNGIVDQQQQPLEQHRTNSLNPASGHSHGFLNFPSQGPLSQRPSSGNRLGHLAPVGGIGPVSAAGAPAVDAGAAGLCIDVLDSAADPAAAAAAAAAAALGGGSREDLKAILVSIGQELARHSISVETAVTSGWLGVLTATDVAVLADAYAEEERRVMTQKPGAPAAAAPAPADGLAMGLPPAQPRPASASAAAPFIADWATIGGPSSGGASDAAAPSQLPHGSGTDVGSGTGSVGERSATAAILALTASSPRTSLSVAPSEDGGSSAASGPEPPVLTQAPSGAGSATGSALSGNSQFDRASFNAFQYGFFRVGGVDGDVRLAGLEGPEAAALAEVFGEKPWPPFGAGLMADDLGLSAAAPPLPPLPRGAKIIDSASQYESRLGLGNGGMLLTGMPGGPASGARAASADAHLHLTCALPADAAGGLPLPPAPPASSLSAKGVASAPGGLPSAPAAAQAGIDREMENRFANLDLGCGFY